MSEKKTIAGKSISFDDGRKVFLAKLVDLGGWHMQFTNTEGEVTKISLSEEAFEALMTLRSMFEQERFGERIWAELSGLFDGALKSMEKGKLKP